MCYILRVLHSSTEGLKNVYFVGKMFPGNVVGPRILKLLYNLTIKKNYPLHLKITEEQVQLN